VHPFPGPSPLMVVGREQFPFRPVKHLVSLWFATRFRLFERTDVKVGGTRYTRLQAERSWVLDSMNFFPFTLILPASLGPGVRSASNRNEYRLGQLPRNIIFLLLVLISI
jgi:hypothetical protein